MMSFLRLCPLQHFMRVSYFHPLLDFPEGHTWLRLAANIWTRQRRISFDQNLLIVWKFMFESDAHDEKVRARINVRACAVVLIGHGSQDILPVNFQAPLYKPLLFCFQLRHKTLDYCLGSTMLLFILPARALSFHESLCFRQTLGKSRNLFKGHVI